MTAEDLAHQRAELVEELYEIEQAALDAWNASELASLRAERDRVNGRINAIDQALSSDECTPAGEP